MNGILASLAVTIAIIVLGFYINLYFGLFLVIWIIASITYIITNLGRKHGPGYWYDWPLGLPALGISYIWGSVDKFAEKYEKK